VLADAAVNVCGADRRIHDREPRVRGAVESPNPNLPEIVAESGPVGGLAAKQGRPQCRWLPGVLEW
jgi:hypothetical protein